MANPSQPEYVAPDVDIVPGVSILGVLSNLNYEPWFALAEYVDNAVQSAARAYARLVQDDPRFVLAVDVDYDDHDGGRITILDNAGGIARRDFSRAFKAAEVPPDRSGLSEFGMGMKSASIWFANNWRVTTTSVGDPNTYTVEFDMAAVLERGVHRLHVDTAAGAAHEHFTRIELWNLNQYLRGRTLGKVRDHLREIYRAFLRDGSLRLTVAGQSMHFAEPEVLLAADYHAEADADVSGVPKLWRKTVDFYLDNSVHVTGWAAIRAEGKTSGNGLSLFRRRRVIIGTGDTPYRPTRIYGQGNSYRTQRLFGELEIDGLAVSHTKDAFQWQGLEEEFQEELRRLLDAEPLPLLKQAEHYRARQVGRSELKRIRSATENTAQAAHRALPPALPKLLTATATTSCESTAGPIQPALHDISETFTFNYDQGQWTVTLTASSRPGASSWLTHRVEFAQGDLELHLVLNTSHPFLRQFALGNSDALEAVFRIAVALVVAESLQTTAGDGESAATFMRRVNALLGTDLAKRLRSDT